MTENLRGAALMMGSMATFTLNDACLKLLAQGLPTFQAVTLRGVGVITLLLILAHLTGALRQPIPKADRPAAYGRSLMEICAFLPFVIALTHMPLANITAILQVLPLTITAAGAVFLGERVGPRRWAAIALGFLGVLLIIRPGPAGFDHWSLLVLLAVAFITARDLLTRRLSPQVPSLKVAILTATGITALGIALSLGDPWQPIAYHQGALIAGASLFILGGYVFSIMAMRHGEVAVVTPFRYTAILWGLLLGLLVFGDWPDAVTLLGAALVVASGLYTFWRETRATRLNSAAPQ
ncbi:MAG: DMT family transporter [Pseudomonadota bacterium]